MIVRIVWITIIQCVILAIFGLPANTLSFWSALYNGCTILGKIIFFIFGKAIVWFPTDVSITYIIGFLIGCLITAGAIYADND